jgi:hypothetical protein
LLFVGVNGFGGVLNAFPIPRMKRSSAPGSSSTTDLDFLAMTDKFGSYADMPAPRRARLLVGTYIQMWAFMETDLNDAIEVALGLDSLQGIIVCKNINLRDKIYILKSIITLNDPTKMYEAEIDALSDISDIAGKERNMIAHDAFAADTDGDGVRFFVMKAKGKLTFPETRWSIADFDQKIQNLTRLASILRSIADRFTKKTPDLATLLQEPTNALSALAYPDPQSHLPQGNLGLGLLGSIPQTDDETK